MGFTARVKHTKALDFMSNQGNASINAIVCCPPDGRLGPRVKWDTPVDMNAFTREAYRITAEDGICLIVSGRKEANRIAINAEKNGWMYRQEYAERAMTTTGQYQGKRFPKLNTEIITILYKGNNYYYNILPVSGGTGSKPPKYLRDNTFFPVVTPGSKCQFKHAGATPRNMMEYYMRIYVKPNSVVLDPFCGSGTTAEVCYEMGCHFIGCDRDKDFVLMTQKRITHLRTGKKTVRYSRSNPTQNSGRNIIHLYDKE
jgi:DNA modification methylase